jgi:integrase/recombinase XerD
MTPLRKRMIENMEMRNFACKTIRLYVEVVARFARYFGKSPELLGTEEVRRYLLHLVHEKKLAWATYKQALAALRYLYRWVLQAPEIVQDIRGPRPERRLPVVLSFDEVQRFFAAIPSFKQRMILMAAYAAGLRISEVVHLEVTDIDSSRMVIRVRQGKRKKDRYTILSPVLLQMLRHYWVAARPVRYLFPGRALDRPMSVSVVQRACKDAQVKAGIDKTVTPHTLRIASAYYSTFKRMAYFHGNSPWSGDVFRGWRPCRTAVTAACTVASCRSSRAMIHGARATVCCAGNTRCLISRLITVSLTSRVCAACSTVSQSTQG